MLLIEAFWIVRSLKRVNNLFTASKRMCNPSEEEGSKSDYIKGESPFEW
jgi:hypothetical protein